MLNIVSLCGRTTANLELKKTTSGKDVVSFTLAVDRDYASNGERETDFVPIVLWGNTAVFASKYFSKGQMMIVNGRLQVRGYTDKDGNKRTVTEVVANNVYFAGDKKQDKPQPKQTEKFDDFDEFTEDGSLPF